MSAVLALLCGLILGLVPQDQSSTRATLAEWRELLQLDLAEQVLATGPARVAPGGDLAAEGEAIALVARALFEHGRESAALELLASATPSPTSAPFVELERARTWIENDELERALEFLMPGPDAKSLRASGHPESWLLVGRAWTRSGEPERARPFLERFVALAPYHRETPAALHMLAQAAVRAGDGPRASQLSQQAQKLGRWHAFLRVRTLQVREQPDAPLPRLGLAQLWLQAGNLDRAELELSRLFVLEPEHAAGWFHQGEIERKRGDLPAAARAFDRALAGDPGLFIARHNRAVIALGERRFEDARRDLELLVAGEHGADHRIVGAHLLLARLLLETGEIQAAQARYARYQELGGREPLGP